MRYWNIGNIPGANNPREEPEADFEITAEKIEAGEYCSIHGLWRSK